MAKLVVNIGEGTIEIEGDEKFILNAFAEVREALKELEAKPVANPKSKNAAPSVEPEPGTTQKAQTSKASGGKSKASKVVQPTLNSNLDLSGLLGFVEAHKPKNNTEKILVFAAFLRDKLSIKPCSFDDIYSCFHSLKSSMKIPQAFAKNMHDAKSAGFIEYTKLSEISIPIMGENKLTDLSKKAAE